MKPLEIVLIAVLAVAVIGTVIWLIRHRGAGCCGSCRTCRKSACKSCRCPQPDREKTNHSNTNRREIPEEETKS